MRILDDFKAFNEKKTTAQKISTVFFNPCFHAVCIYRLSNLFYRLYLAPIAKIIWYLNRIVFNVDIDYRADLAGGLVLIHGLGVVIGKSVISKGRLTLYQGVTIGGGNGKPNRLDTDGVERGMPLFLGDTIIYTSAIVVGGIVIEPNTVIKAGTIITHDM